MNTQISLEIKDESIFSKAFTLFWFVNIFKKSKVKVIFDDYEMELKASKTLYTYDVQPGTHTLKFYDPKAGQKNFTRKMVGTTIGGSIGLAGGGADSVIVGAKLGETAIQENIVSCNLLEGDHLKLSCKCKSNGKIKIKMI